MAMSIFERCKQRWNADPSQITEAQLRKYVACKLLTADQFKEITGKEY